MDQFIQTTRRPTTFEGNAIQSILKESAKQYSFLRNSCEVIECGDGGVILSIGKCNKDKNDNDSILIEIHMDEVAIQLLSPVRDTGNSIGVPVWKAKALGNSKFHVWGEKMDIISMPSQTKLGTGFIMQNPPHCEELEARRQESMGEDFVWIRMDSEKTHRRIQKARKKRSTDGVVAMFSSKVNCNREFCIGPGIDNSVSWYVVCEALEHLYSRKIPTKKCCVQLSTGEEMGKSKAILKQTMITNISHFICLDTDVSEMPGVYPKNKCTVYTNNPNSTIYNWLTNQTKFVQVPPDDIVGGTNEALYSHSISSSVNIGIPIVAMHSAHEQVSRKMIRNAIQLLKKCLKLNQSLVVS